MVTSVSIPEGTAPDLIIDLLGREHADALLTAERRAALNATAGIQFLFDAGENYLDEVNDWQARQAARTPSRHTRATRSTALKTMIGWFAARNLRWQDCTELAHINLMQRAFRSAEAPVVSKGTWNQWMDHWWIFLKHAEKDGLIDSPSFDRTDLRERGKSVQVIRALSGEEFRRFVSAVGSQRMRAGCLALMGTGLRIGELAALKLSDIPDPQAPQHKGLSYIPAEIIGKGRKQRRIVWPLRALKAIAHYVNLERALAVETLIQRVEGGEVRLEKTYLTRPHPASQGADLREQRDAPLWLAENGDPLSYHRWGKDFANVSKKSEIRCSPHLLRHSYAIVTLSMLIKAQIRQEIIDGHLGKSGHHKHFMHPLREVQERLGHASLDTTMIYLDHIAEHRALIAMAVVDFETLYLDV